MLLLVIAIISVVALFSGAAIVILAKSGEQETFGGVIVLVAGLIFVLSGVLLMGRV